MNSSLYIGATGMKGLAEGMHVTTNNLANVSTIGFKKQDMLFADMISQTQASMGNWWNAQENSRVAIGQVGMGLQIEAVRTSYNQGGFESTNTMTDMAIDGKGFFQVTDGENTYYTRAGDFRADKEGVWRTPSGLALNGYQINENGEKGELGEVKVDKFQTMKPKATSGIELSVNVDPGVDNSKSGENPYFALMSQYDATAQTLFPTGAAASSQQMKIYDANGESRTVTAYFDGAPSAGGNRYSEFVIVDDAAAANAETAGAGLLMSGVLEFDSDGNLRNVSAFTPGTPGDKELSGWTSAPLVDGKPVINVDGSEISLNLGLAATDGWQGGVASAAEVGADPANLPGVGKDALRADFPITAYNTSAYVNSYKQDGYAEGAISSMSVGSDGIVTGTFSNGQSAALWEIPVARFTSEDGLYREGGNLFSATEASGEAELGTPGTENYGEVRAYNIENSNVDMAQEMVNMIINQRGFQSNSKVVTTADQMLQKAMELKR